MPVQHPVRGNAATSLRKPHWTLLRLAVQVHRPMWYLGMQTCASQLSQASLDPLLYLPVQVRHRCPCTAEDVCGDEARLVSFLAKAGRMTPLGTGNEATLVTAAQ